MSTQYASRWSGATASVLRTWPMVGLLCPILARMRARAKGWRSRVNNAATPGQDGAPGAVEHAPIAAPALYQEPFMPSRSHPKPRVAAVQAAPVFLDID